MSLLLRIIKKFIIYIRKEIVVGSVNMQEVFCGSNGSGGSGRSTLQAGKSGKGESRIGGLDRRIQKAGRDGKMGRVCGLVESPKV
jgi:hypothetical protein